MKRFFKILIFSFLIGFSYYIKAQNLVKNGSFEDIVYYPSNSGTLAYSAYYWKIPLNHSGSPDLYHKCASGNVQIPPNFAGYQDTCHGSSYAGHQTFRYHTTYNNREYIVGELSDTLLKDSCYTVSFKYSCSDSFNLITSNYGILFSDTIPVYIESVGMGMLSYDASIDINQWLSDTENWVTIKRYYKAVGGEKYITLGSFLRSSATPFKVVSDRKPNYYWDIAYIYIDDIEVQLTSHQTLPQLNLGNDTILCEGEQITFGDLLPPGTVHVWNNLSNDTSYVINKTGLYWLDAYNGCAYTADTIFVEFVKPQSLGNDTVLCKEQGLFLNGYHPHPETEYLWSTGDTVSLIAAEEEKLYWLKTTIGSCTFSDSIEVKYHIPASAVLPTQNVDTSICLSGELTAPNTALWNETYKWSTGENTEIIMVSEDGIYNVEIKNECTEGNISYNVKIEKEEQGYNPSNIFTPNGDGINDILLLYEGNSEMFELSIYNRWGKLIWQTQDPSQSWNGEGISDGVYHYELRFRNCAGDMIEKKGSVSVVR